MTQSPITPSGPKSPITDSLWFWLLIYGSMGVLALAAIAPKHLKRQERLDRMSNARQDVWRKQVEGQAPAAAEDSTDMNSSSSGDAGPGDPSNAEGSDDKYPKTRSIDPLPMLLIVAAVVWLAGSLTMIFLPRLSRRYYPRFTHDAPSNTQAPS